MSPLRSARSLGIPWTIWSLMLGWMRYSSGEYHPAVGDEPLDRRACGERHGDALLDVRKLVFPRTHERRAHVALHGIPVPAVDRQLRDLPGREVRKQAARQRLALRSQAGDFLGRIDLGRAFAEVLQLVNLRLKLGDRLFEIQKVQVHGAGKVTDARRAVKWQSSGVHGHREPLDLAMTTNGSLLGSLAVPLHAAGLDRLTVSLDSLHPATFAQMSGSALPLSTVLAGIAAARAAGFNHLKLNCVVRRGVNDTEIEALVDYARANPGKLEYGSTGIGTTPHLAVEEFCQKANNLRCLLLCWMLPPHSVNSWEFQQKKPGWVDPWLQPWSGILFQRSLFLQSLKTGH